MSTYHIPGRNPIAGDYRGVDAVIELLAHWMEHTEHFKRLSTLLQATAGDEHLLVVIRRSITIHGQSLQWG